MCGICGIKFFFMICKFVLLIIFLLSVWNFNFLFLEIKLFFEVILLIIFKLIVLGFVIFLVKMMDFFKVLGDSFKLKNIKVKYKYEYVLKIWL